MMAASRQEKGVVIQLSPVVATVPLWSDGQHLQSGNNRRPGASLIDHPVGGALFAAGGYLALGGVFTLGSERTYGYEGELVESGPYRFTRNPQYVGAVLSFVGLNLICNSASGLAATLIASVWLLLLPFAEEPWLRGKLGARYEEYAARVPRYLGLSRSPEQDS